MRTAFALAATMTLALYSTASADDLFSRIPIDKVFPSSGGGASLSGSTSVTPRETPRRLSGSESLTDVARSAGFEPKQVGNEVVSIKMELDKWSIPVLLVLSEDENQLRLVMLLSVIRDDRTIPADKLMGLLSANREHTSAAFAYSMNRRRIELHRAVSGRELTADRLREQLSSLGEIAMKTQELWNFAASPAAGSATASSTNAAASPGNAANPASAKSTTAPSLVGKWSATRSANEAFAMQIHADGTFALVTVSGGKTSQSKGNYTFSGQSLTLTGSDGTRLAGKVQFKSAGEFQFVPENSPAGTAGLTFKQAT